MTELPEAIFEHLAHARQTGATDLHIHKGGRVSLWIGGIHHTEEVVSEDDIRSFVDFVLDDHGKGEMHRWGRAVRMISASKVGRVRCTVYLCGGETYLDLRMLQREIPSFDSLGSSDAVRSLADFRTGLILLAGPPDSGKTTTTAAIVNEINCGAGTGTNIITVERTVEYEHESQNSLVQHIHVGPGKDTDTVANGIRTALVSNARIIVVGELLMDYDTARAAIDALEAGFLVLANVHTPDPILAPERLIAPFPPDERHRARTVVANTLAAAVGLRLTHTDSGEMVQVTEMLFGGPAVSKQILDGRTTELRTQIGNRPNHSFEQSLNDLIRSQRIDVTMAERIMATIDPSRSGADLAIA